METTTEGETKKCPLCAETIKADAIRCRFCGGDVSGATLCKCGGVMAEATLRSTPTAIVVVGVLLILGGTIGIPFFGIGLLGIAAGIVLMAAIKESIPILRCQKCRLQRRK